MLIHTHADVQVTSWNQNPMSLHNVYSLLLQPVRKLPANDVEGCPTKLWKGKSRGVTGIYATV